MSQPTEQKIEQIELILSDYQSELRAIDIEINQEKELILEAINSEQADIKSLLEQYRQIKRDRELNSLNSVYQELTEFKESLSIKIEAASNVSDLVVVEESEQPDSIPTEQDTKIQPQDDADTLETQIISAQDTEIQPDNPEELRLAELIEFIEQRSAQELVKLYPADISQMVSSFAVNDSQLRDRVLHHYQQQDPDVYQALLKLYLKPDIVESIDIPDVETLSPQERKYHEFLEADYPQSLPFFWFLINREASSIRRVVMEFAVDHIIQTNTLDNDPHRRDLTFRLSELLEMNNGVPTADFLRDLFLCFHPQRISQKNNTRNKYFDYLDSLITSQSTLEHSNILHLWNYMNQSGYKAVAAANFVPDLTSEDGQNGHDSSLASSNEHDLL